MRYIVLSFFVLVISSVNAGEGSVKESEYIKDGFLCLDELCIGDTLKSTLAIQWQTAMTRPPKSVPVRSAPFRKVYLDNLKRYVRADKATLKALTPYWSFSSVELDKRGLELMTKVKALCNAGGAGSSATATYLSASGFPTDVTFRPVPSFGASNQEYLVTEIKRNYGRITESQRQQVLLGIKERYGEEYFSAFGKKSDFTLATNFIDNGFSIVWRYDLKQLPGRELRFEDNPACGGGGSIKLD